MSILLAIFVAWQSMCHWMGASGSLVPIAVFLNIFALGSLVAWTSEQEVRTGFLLMLVITKLMLLVGILAWQSELLSTSALEEMAFCPIILVMFVFGVLHWARGVWKFSMESFSCACMQLSLQHSSRLQMPRVDAP